MRRPHPTELLGLPLARPALLAGYLAALAVPTWSAPSQGHPSPTTRVAMNLNTVLSEDQLHAAALEESLNHFLDEARKGEFSDRYVDATELERYSFFFDGISRVGTSSSSTYHPPRVLKSFSFDSESYFVTVAFTGERDGAPFTYKIVEFQAVPSEYGYRFHCPFPSRTASFEQTVIRDVTFHHSEKLDADAAAEFARFRENFSSESGVESKPLDYYCFASLEEMLASYGFVYDVTKCNFLAHDLGFVEDGGRVFVTGTGRPDYVFGYLSEYLYYDAPNAENLYGPFVRGMATYYGGYGLTGENVEELKSQFRAKLANEPSIDFLEEFRKGRKSSVNRHFSYFVMSAFLCQAAVERHGLEAALRIAHAGSNGERFFELLGEVLGVTEANFDATIRSLIAA